MSSSTEGKFVTNLKRTNSQLRADRGKAIEKSAEKFFRRYVEDLKDQLESLIDDRENCLDVNPSNTTAILRKSDFDSAKFVEQDMEMSLKIRNLRIQIDVAQARYDELFKPAQ